MIWQIYWRGTFCMNCHFLWGEPPPLPLTFVIYSRENHHFSDMDVEFKEKLFYRIEVTLLVLQMDTSIVGKEDQASSNSLSKKFLQKNYRKGKTEQNDRQLGSLKRRTWNIISFFIKFPPGCDGWQMKFNSSELENGGNQESMKIRNPFQNFFPFFVGGKKGVTWLKQLLIDRAKKRDDSPDTYRHVSVYNTDTNTYRYVCIYV